MTLDDLRDSARSKSDEQSDGFITNSELDRFLNQGMRYVYNKVIQAYEDYFIVKGTQSNGGLIMTVNGTNEYSLPATMQKLVRVERRDSSGTTENDWRRLPRLNIGNNQINDYYPVRQGYDQGYGYYVAGNFLYLRPSPTDSFSLRLWFIPVATVLSNGTDIPTVPVEFHELIAEYAAMQILRKSGEGIYKESQELFNLDLQNLLDTVTHRSLEPQQMIITDDNFDGSWRV